MITELNRLIGARRILDHAQGEQMIDWQADQNWPILLREMLHAGREFLISKHAKGDILIYPDVRWGLDGPVSGSFLAPCLGDVICQVWAKWRGLI